MPAAAGAQLTARANHEHISVNPFYHGSEVSVRGISDPGTDLVIMIESPEGDLALKIKDKVGGVLWMNAGEEEFEHIPELYFLRSSKDIKDMLSVEEQEKYVIGHPALEKHATIEPVADETEKDKRFDEFIKLKETGKLYVSDA